MHRNKLGNTVITLNSETYQTYLSAILEYVSQIEGENSQSELQILESRKVTDKNDIEIEIILKMKVKNTAECCTVTFYHTTYRLLINGKGREIFFTKIHTRIANTLFQDTIQAPANSLSFLDEITQSMVTQSPRPRQRQNRQNRRSTNSIYIPGSNRSELSSEQLTSSLRSDEQTPREGPDDTEVKTTQLTDSDTEETDLKLVQESPLTIEETDLKSVQDSSLSVESPMGPETQRPNLDRQLPPSPPPSGLNLTSPVHSTAEDNSVPLTCITCDSAVIDNCIECSICQAWLHFNCENLTQDEIEKYTSDESLDYVCASCFLLNLQENEDKVTNCTVPAEAAHPNLGSDPDQTTHIADLNQQPAGPKIKTGTKPKSTTSNKTRKNKKPNGNKNLEKSQTDKIVEMRTEIIRLEGIINDQRDSIRTLKIKIASNEPTQGSSHLHPDRNDNGYPQYLNSVESRLQILENENIKRRLDLLEMQIKGGPTHCMSGSYEKYGPDIECPKCQHKINKQSFLGHGRASQLVHHTNSQTPNLQTSNIGQMTELTQLTSTTQNPIQRDFKDQTLSAKPPNQNLQTPNLQTLNLQTPNLQTPNLQIASIGQMTELTPPKTQLAAAKPTSTDQRERVALSNQTKPATPNLIALDLTNKIPTNLNMQLPDTNLGNKGIQVPIAVPQIVENTPQRHTAHPSHLLRPMQNLVLHPQVPGKQDRGPPQGHMMHQRIWPHMQPLYPSQNPHLLQLGYTMPQMGYPNLQTPMRHHKYIIPMHQTKRPNYNVKVPPVVERFIPHSILSPSKTTI